MSIASLPKEYTREFGTKVLDAGRDGGGVYRDIAREVRIPTIFTQGAYSPLEWYEICKTFQHNIDDHLKLKLNIVDTVIVSNSKVEAYLFTDSFGHVSVKQSTYHKLAKIKQEFEKNYDILRIATANKLQQQTSEETSIAMIIYPGDDPPIMLNRQDFTKMYSDENLPRADHVLQFHVPSKGSASQYRTYQTVYWLDRSAKSFMKTDRLDIKSQISGNASLAVKANMDKVTNAEMETAVAAIVHRVENIIKCRIVKLLVEFVQDFNGKIWLLRTRECLAATEYHEKKVYEPFKLVRTSKASEIGENLDRGGSAGSISDGYIRSKPYKIGRHSDDRVDRRIQKDRPPDDDLVHEILSGIDRKVASRGCSSHQRLSPLRGTSADSINHYTSAPASNYHALQIPNARLGIEVPIADSTNMFGSSQLGGCQGDFCNFDLNYISSSAMVLGNGSSSDGACMQLSRSGKRMNGNSAASISQLMKSTKSPKKSIRLENSKDDSMTNEGTRLVQVAYRSIIQARQEMPLVKLLLGRHKRGEVAEYVSQESYDDLAISGKLPSHYYKDVQCCMNCFKVYQIVNEAREESMKKINKKKDHERARSLSPSSSTVNSAGAADHYASSLASSTSLKQAHKPMSIEAQNSLKIAVEAIDSVTKLDVAEIRTMIKPPAAVEVVLEAVMCLLIGKVITWTETRKLLGGGENILQLFKDFKLEDISDERLRLVEGYVDNPVFRPVNVLPISYCASKFCAWVLGVVQAARWQRGTGHIRTDVIHSSDVTGNSSKDYKSDAGKSLTSKLMSSTTSLDESSVDELTFVQKLERKKAKKIKEGGKISRANDADKGLKSSFTKPSKQQQPNDSSAGIKVLSSSMSSKSIGSLMHTVLVGAESSTLQRNVSVDDMHSIMSLEQRSMESMQLMPSKETKVSKKDQNAIAANQKKTIERLISQDKTAANMSLVGQAREFKCADGITKMPYITLGALSLNVKRCNFIVIHDFFDTCDATAILVKPITQRHDGCQILCFNYPGQANTVWPRLPAVERERGAKEPIINNDWIADRLHELLQHAEEEGDILLSSPFHLVGFGNGACIAAAFSQRWGGDSRYSNSLRSILSINGFLYPDAQLSSVLHSATQIFESTPHTRPDIPISYWSSFLFSEDYLSRVNPNLVLNLYTAVSNPITNAGRAKLTKGSLQHRDLRGGLSPDYIPSMLSDTSLHRVQVPIILVQSTENVLVNAANVDPFLSGRNTRHLWSHQLNMLSQATLNQAMDINAQWVGKMSKDPTDYQKFSILGKTGLRMLLDTIKNPRGAFCMWTRAGHNLQQENKAAILDLMDFMACPTEEYCGFESVVTIPSTATKIEVQRERESVTSKMEVMFKLVPPKQVVIEGKTLPIADAVDDGQSSIDDTYVASPEKDAESNTDALCANDNIDLPNASMDGSIVQYSYQELGNSNPVDSEVNESNDELGDLAKIVTAEVAGAAAEECVDEGIDAPIINVVEVSYAPPPPALVTNRSALAEEVEGAASRPISHVNYIVPAVALSPIRTSVSPNVESFMSPINAAAAKVPSTSTTIASDRSPTITDNVANATISSSGRMMIDDYANSSANASNISIESTSTSAKIKMGVSSKKQRDDRAWTAAVPDISTAMELESDLAHRAKEFYDMEAAQRDAIAAEAHARIGRFEVEQELRRKQYEDEDRQLLSKLQAELDARRQERDASERQRRYELQEIEKKLIANNTVSGYDDTHIILPVKEMIPMAYEEPIDLPKAISDGIPALDSTLDKMMQDEEAARKKGIMSLEAYESVQNAMIAKQMERDQKLRQLAGDEQQELIDLSIMTIQRIGRGYNGRKKASVASEKRALQKRMVAVVIKFQALIRGFLGRRRFARMVYLYQMNLKRGASIILIQSVMRGFRVRKYIKIIRKHNRATKIQRLVRGRLGRKACKRERARLETIRRKYVSASRIQGAWRMKVAKEEFRSLRIHMLACIEIQRCYRGYLGRKQTRRRRVWESAQPGPERIKLGMKMIEESKVAFEKQQEEIDALHRAQERAEARVSHIHAELKDAEKELTVLERELLEIDQIERDLQTLTHERDILTRGVTDAAGMPRTALKGHEDLILGRESNNFNDPDFERRKKAEAYALEMTIQIKRAEREKKKQELETEFASVFKEVDKKRKALERLELSLADMESTRERKDREFRRLQKNLMQLLLEQKQELDDLREKGIELETATATTAAAATATAQKAKEHEQRSTAMFSQTEELMKFQFMSMSLSYFSSLNMLKQLRDMNADTTASAVTSSADAASAAAAAAAAANLPNIKKMNLGANDFVDLTVQKKKAELQASETAEKEAKKARGNPLPENVKSWTVTDISRWLDSIYLGQYVAAFREACVDGPFLMELREEDFVQVLGMSHKLHVRKVLVCRDKLKPLSEQELILKEAVENEDRASKKRKDVGVPTIDMVFSQARNSRNKRVEESLNLGFGIDTEDEKGNTLLLIAAQNSNKKLVEMLLVRGSNINHQNAQGNTALHFALAFDSEGILGEYLIEHGADDTIENVEGLTAYDGLV